MDYTITRLEGGDENYLETIGGILSRGLSGRLALL
jgi:hypothetical protein